MVYRFSRDTHSFVISLIIGNDTKQELRVASMRQSNVEYWEKKLYVKRDLMNVI